MKRPDGWTNPAKGHYFVCLTCRFVFFVPLECMTSEKCGTDPLNYDVTCTRCSGNATPYTKVGGRYRPWVRCVVGKGPA